MLLALTAVASLSIGYDLSQSLWPKDRGELSWAERALYASILGIALWLASMWAIAFLHVLVRPVLVGRTIGFAIVAVTLRIRAGMNLRELSKREFDPRTVALFGLPLLPLFLWTIFILWRSIVVPPLSHDALAYHLPKAALWVQAHGYEPLDRVSFAIGPRPSNYEMMLADAIVLDDQDTYTEWLGTLFYLLFPLACIAMTHRWWGDDPVVATAMALFVGGIPLLLLHSGAHKNDVMTAHLMVAGVVAAGRFISSRELRALAISGIAFAAAAGTKQHGAIMAICIAPFLIRPLIRAPWTARRAAAIALVAVLAFCLLGPGPYYANRLPGARAEPVADSGPAKPFYGDWSNLWIGPWVLLTAPFSSNGAIFIPGHGRWFWRRYEIYFSHLGAPFAIAALLLIFGIARYRRHGPKNAWHERDATTIATTVAFLLLMPIHSEPFGIYMSTLPRFVLFIVPVVLNWTLAPALSELSQRKLARPALTLAVASICFIAYAIDNAINDTFAPARYVAWASQHPGTRVIPFDPYRPASIVDRMAGPNDVIAIDGASSTWIYPAFGAKLTRRLILLPPRKDGVVQVPDEAKWLIVDRSWSVIWGDPRFRSLAQTGTFLAQGKPGSTDTSAYERALHDDRFVAVALRPSMLQGVWVRR
ncbi:MAG: hypothetical protein ACJ74H_02330 [Thermoanaerobaculia bacterium]